MAPRLGLSGMVLACWLSASRAYSSCLTIWTNPRRARRPAKAQAMKAATTRVRVRTTLGGGLCPPSDSSPRLKMAPAKPPLDPCRSGRARRCPPILPGALTGPGGCGWVDRRRRERRTRREAGPAGDELPREPDLIVARQHHAELGAGLALDARERLERGQLDAQAIARLLELGPARAEAVEPIGQAHLLDAEPDHTEDQGHEEPRAGQRHRHGAEA